MGSPEFPGDENDRQNQFQPPPSHALPMHGIVNSETEEEDSNDDAPIPAGGGGGGDGTTAEPTSFDPSQPYAAEGYHPLNFEIRTADDETDSADDEDGASSSSSNSIAAVAQAAEEPEEVSAEIETTAEREILSEIWNAPRPLESADIALDNDKAEQIKSVMSRVSLQLAAVQPPQWAIDVPESKWIEKLLEDVRSKGTIPK